MPSTTTISPFDPLNIKTILDDDDMNHLSEEEEEVVVNKNKKKKSSSGDDFSESFFMFSHNNNNTTTISSSITYDGTMLKPTDDDVASSSEEEDDDFGEDVDDESDTHSNISDHDETEELLDHQDKIREKTLVKPKKSNQDASYFEEVEQDSFQTNESFVSLSLSRPLLKAISHMGFVKPTQIQSLSIPFGIQGRDICGSAVTGSGKTAAFMIPILERLVHRPKKVPVTRAMVLVPTRELGVQVHSVASSLARFTDIQLCLLVGGMPTKQQELELKKRPDVIIATPGRLIDHIHNSAAFSLDAIEILVIDEADRILEDGFADELNEIIKYTPKSRQTMLFSATMTDNVNDLIRLSLNKPVRLFVDQNTAIATKLVQEFVRVRETREESRPAILTALCSRTYTQSVIIFFRTKAAAHHMKILFTLLGLKAVELHGNLNQTQRLDAIEQFRTRKAHFLLATDVASRGLDIPGIKSVINYDMPKSYSIYVHRVGRTARGQAGGCAVSLVGEADRGILKLAMKNASGSVKNRILPPSVIESFSDKLASLEDKVKEIYQREKEEKEMAKAEMEITKASNILQHSDEIASRPARVWFQSESEKQKSKKLGAEDTSKAESAIKRGKYDGLSRKKKRKLKEREEAQEDLRAQKLVAKRIKATRLPQKMTQFKTSQSSLDSFKHRGANGKSSGKSANKSMKKHAIKMKKKK